MDTVVELIDANGLVLARSDDSYYEEAEVYQPAGLAKTMDRDIWLTKDFYSTNPRDPGMRLVLPGPEGEVQTYYVRVMSTLAIPGWPMRGSLWTSSNSRLRTASRG